MGGLLRSLFGRAPSVPAPTPEDWAEALALPVLTGLSAEERRGLEDLARRFLEDKHFSPVSGAAPSGADMAHIASLAALPILHIGYGWYEGWSEVIIYPEQFVPEREVTDDFGVVHRVHQPLSGEAWAGGPLILSLDDVAWSGQGEGYNVVVHEFAHKLDMKNGPADGRPPMHSGMRAAEWATAFNAAYQDFQRRLDHRQHTEIDPYAGESPAEFFAVLSEYFFELPDLLRQVYPQVYRQLSLFYRQDPFSRLEHAHHDPAAP